MIRKSVRWGRVAELDRRFRVGSPGYKSYPNRLKHLHSWREAHALAKTHMPVRMYGTRNRIRPSSNLPLKGKASKERLVQKLRTR
jgi:hypothetical protein